jgi:hypothetical protein
MRTPRSVLAVVSLLASMAGAAWADDGLQVPDASSAWPRWQARLGISMASTRTDLSLFSSTGWRGAQVLGDYYFAGPGFGGGRMAGGFRATSGLLLGPRSAALSTPALASSSQALSITMSSRDAAAEALGTAPYLGVGYTGVSLRGGWGFTADLGVMAVNGSGLRVGRSMQSADDLMRDLRLSPVLQLGVSYSF